MPDSVPTWRFGCWQPMTHHRLPPFPAEYYIQSSLSTPSLCDSMDLVWALLGRQSTSSCLALWQEERGGGEWGTSEN